MLQHKKETANVATQKRRAYVRVALIVLPHPHPYLKFSCAVIRTRKIGALRSASRG